MFKKQKDIDLDKERRKIKSVALMKKIMKKYYFRAKTANWRRKKVAWITSGGPVEPLIAMDVIPVYPENHGAMIGATKMGVELCEKSEAMGYSRDLCSYAGSDIACSIAKGGPIGGLPKPDFLVCCNKLIRSSNSSCFNGASLAPKSTVFALICLIPPPEPMDW